MILAEGVEVPWEVTVRWIWGALGALGVVSLVFTVAIQARKLFGRTPPLGDELKSLRGEIYHAKNSVKKELRAEMARDSLRITELEGLYREMQLDRERKWNELQAEYRKLETTLAFIRGKFEHDKIL